MQKTIDKILLCNLKLLNKKKYHIIWIDEWKDELIVFKNEKNEIKIFSSICPHFGGEIVYDSKENILKCKWHGWKFCTKKGKCLTHNILGKLQNYEFAIEPKNLQNFSYIVDKDNVYAIRNT